MYANRAYRDLLQRQLEKQSQCVDVERLLADPAEMARCVTISDENGQVIPPADWPTERALRGETLTGPSAIEAYFGTDNGNAVQLSVTASPVCDADGQIIGAAAVFRDVTARRQLERQVAEQANQLEAIFEAQADGVVVFDTQGRILRSNRALIQLLGLDADADYIRLPLEERVQQIQLFDERGQRLPFAQAPHWRVLRGETLAGASAMDYRIHTVDGRELSVSTTGAPIRSASGDLTGIVLITRDVTVRRQLERQVQEQAIQLETIFDTMTDGVFVLDAEGQVTRINPAGQAFFGRTSGDGITSTATERAGWLNLRDGDGKLLQFAQLPTVRLLRGDVLTGENAMTLLLSAGARQECTVSLTGGPMRDANGQIVGAVGVVRDVTELVGAQVALAEQERLFRTLVENSPDIITRFDRNLRHLYVSPASEAVTGITATSRIGKTYAEIGLPEAEFAPWERSLQNVFDTGQPQIFETGYQAPDRSPRVSQVRYIPERATDGSIESVLGITSDITPLKRVEEALRHSEERFSKAFHASPVAMAITSPATGRILDANAALLQLTGYCQVELIGQVPSELGLVDP
ncbi:MAG TPA: PAS domain S-box protein, partial [Ktedonobacterales bacterium]